MQISYAQNFEDVILWRALKHVAKGFYIDIGAQDPLIDSVSLAFYAQGWRGLHVEPSPVYASALRKARPDERVIEAAVGTAGNQIEYFDIPGTGLGTTVAETAAVHSGAGRQVSKRLVACRTLASILDEFADREIHWMKIDVEGGEADVLTSWSPSQKRPWIVVVESTKPNSPEQTHQTWDATVTALGYEFCYFDGLNRFYLSEHHPELKAAFSSGPNVFDAFALSGTASAWFGRKLSGDLAESEAKCSSLLAELHIAESDVSALGRALTNAQGALAQREHKIADFSALADAANRDLAAVHASSSWRLTAPIRGAKTAFGGIQRPCIGVVRAGPKLPRRIARRLVYEAIRLASRHPRVVPYLKRALMRVPVLHQRVQRFAIAHGIASPRAPTPPLWSVYMIDPEVTSVQAWHRIFAAPNPAGSDTPKSTQ